MDFLIHKLVWELKSTDETAATNAQELASELSEDRMFLTELEQTLMRIVPADSHLSLDRLEIDVNWSNKSQIRSHLIDAISNAVRQSLENKPGSTEQKAPKKQATGQSFLEMVVAFMRLGTLPENVSAEVRTVEQFLAYIHQESKDADALGKALKSFLNANIELLDEATKWPMPGLIRLLTYDEELVEKSSFIEDKINQIDAPPAVKRTVRKILLHEVITASDAIDFRKVRHQLENLAENLDDEDKIKVLNLAIKLAPRGRQNKFKPIDPVIERAQQDEKLAGKVFIRNAGFVLTAPFLPPLLSTMKLEAENPMHLPQIMRIFSFMDLGLQDEMGADLSLYRILLGQEPNAQIFPSSKPLTDKQENEAKDLLVEMIEHWKALKNTSVQGLRSNFFWRTGYLKPSSEGWQIKVESKAQDVLLAHLPWSIGIIKLPWMKKPLYVDWI